MGGIRDQKGWIWNHGSQTMGSGSTVFRDQGSGCTIFVGSGTKIGHAFGIKDQKFACKNRMKKHTSLPPSHKVLYRSQKSKEGRCSICYTSGIVNFPVVSLVTWPLSGRESGS